MNFNDLLKNRKPAIIKKWFHATADTYPSNASNFIKSQADCFHNPVGYTLAEGVEGLFDGLLRDDANSERFFPYLNDIIKIKAVQDFSPSNAISFIFLLKPIIREEIAKETNGKNFSDELLSFESEIDGLALLSFDIYMKCRERIYEIKTEEVKRMTFGLLKRANLICDIRDQEPENGSESVLTQKIEG
ncbi:MAG: hypothetical protein FJ240_00545 [Nitrospira sp.]|nr:hypothetical protein [Nitrospira sp.]